MRLPDTSTLTIRAATITDVPLLTRLIHELAEFERLGHETAITEEDVVRDGFGERPRFRALIAEWDKKVAGYALFFEFYSSFQGRPGLFLEDIFVRADFRQHGIGTTLLAAVPKLRGKRIISACAGKCWTGISRRSISTRTWAPSFSTNGARSC